jgi:hypothetical protein
VARKFVSLSISWAVLILLPTIAAAQCGANCGGEAESANMDLVGSNNLQGRGGYIPAIEKQGERWFAYVGHLSNTPPQLNPLTGQVEANGTSIVEVTDPKHPKYIAHIPSGMGRDGSFGGSAFLRVCSGADLPRADHSKFYLLRNSGTYSWEIWDVTNPATPSRVSVIASGLEDTHTAWWECNTGIAYLSGGPLNWSRTSGGDLGHALIYDLSDPVKPAFVRDFGLPGQQPGSALPRPIVGLHGTISTGPKGNRVYFSYGDGANGVVEIVDRDKLLHGPAAPSDDNLRYPVIGRIDLPPDAGVAMSFPLLKMQLPEFAKQKEGFTKDFLAVIGQQHNDSATWQCHDSRQMLRMFDITTESRPVGVSTWTVPEASGNFCDLGALFGTHSSNENFTPIYYNRILFVAHHAAGVRAVDIRDPYHPTEIGYYIPAVTDKTRETCVGVGAERKCKTSIDTNNLEVDDRGYIYIVDFAGTGLHILELSGEARRLANFSQTKHSIGGR